MCTDVLDSYHRIATQVLFQKTLRLSRICNFHSQFLTTISHFFESAFGVLLQGSIHNESTMVESKTVSKCLRQIGTTMRALEGKLLGRIMQIQVLQARSPSARCIIKLSLANFKEYDIKASTKGLLRPISDTYVFPSVLANI